MEGQSLESKKALLKVLEKKLAKISKEKTR